MKQRRIRPPVKWHGGKYYLAPRLVRRFPKHYQYMTFASTHGGCAAELFAKELSPVEVYNDINYRIFNLFFVLRNRPEDLCLALALTPYNENDFNEALRGYPQVCHVGDTRVAQAHRDYVIWRQSIGGRGDAFSYTKHRIRRGIADVVSAWLTSIDDNLPRAIERLRRVQMFNRPATEIISKFDSADTFFYCDPTYLPETRSSPEVYDDEMTPEQHEELGDVLNSIKGSVMISGYPSKMYDKLYHGWRTCQFNLPNNSAGGRKKQRRIETIWMNY